jgi:hypothetical protein
MCYLMYGESLLNMLDALRTESLTKYARRRLNGALALLPTARPDWATATAPFELARLGYDAHGRASRGRHAAICLISGHPYPRARNVARTTPVTRFSQFSQLSHVQAD